MSRACSLGPTMEMHSAHKMVKKSIACSQDPPKEMHSACKLDQMTMEMPTIDWMTPAWCLNKLKMEMSSAYSLDRRMSYTTNLTTMQSTKTCK